MYTYIYTYICVCHSGGAVGYTRRPRGPPTRSITHARVSLYKILFHFKALLWESIILLLPPPAAKPTLLQHYCTTIAQYTPPPTEPPFACHTLCNIVDGNIV